jgi:hypothetical protein
MFNEHYFKFFLTNITVILLCPYFSFGQLSGKVTDIHGEPLPFASVFVKGGTLGTSCNAQGKFVLTVPKGKHEIGFYYVGYQQKTMTVEVTDKPAEIEVYLEEGTYSLPELEINAKGEDPAYAIIRNTIAKRPIYKSSIESYSCENYIKSLVRLTSAPEVIFGQKIGNLEGVLDEDRSGILYLSESQSEYYYKAKDLSKEIMISSKVSGNDNGFSFNRFGWIDFYENEISVGRPLANPIGNQALNFYEYQLHGAYYNDYNQLVNKIEIIPKNKRGAVVSGFIYIIEQSWLIQSIDLILTKDNTKIDVIDTILIKQVYLPVSEFMPLFQQNLLLKGQLLGFTFEGEILAISSKHQMNRTFDAGFFNKEIVFVQPLSNKKTEEFWQSARPVPLTIDEITDYAKKDSIQSIRKSKVYMDSVDAESNRLKPINFITGYNFQNTYDNYSLGVKAISTWYNPIQGFTAGLRANYEKSYEEKSTKKWSVFTSGLYGFSDRKIRWNSGITWNGSGLYKPDIKIEIGDQIKDINPSNPLTEQINAYLILFNNISTIRFYNSKYAEIKLKSLIGNGHSFSLSSKYEQRRILQNNTNYVFFKKNVLITPNNEFGNDALLSRHEDNTALVLQAFFDIKPGLKYISYPKQRFYTSTPWPTFRFGHKTGFITGAQKSQFHLSTLEIFKNDIWRTIAGNLSINFSTGYFWKKPNSIFDHHFFKGASTTLIHPDNYLGGFQILPIYAHSTNQHFAQFGWEWNDNSYLFDKIRGINKLGFSLVAGHSWLTTPELKNYHEIFMGIDRLGFGVMRLFRLNGVVSILKGKYLDSGVTISARLPI